MRKIAGGQTVGNAGVNPIRGKPLSGPCRPPSPAPSPPPPRPGDAAGHLGLSLRKWVQLVSFGSVHFSGARANSGWRAAMYARVRSGTSA